MIDRRLLAWRKLVQVLKAAPLTPPVRNWYTDPGAPTHQVDLPANVTSVRLTPKLAGERPYSQAPGGGTIYRCETRVMVETRVASSKWEDSAALWAGIARAVAFDPSWQQHGLDDLNPPTPADTPVNNGVSRGELTLITYIER